MALVKYNSQNFVEAMEPGIVSYVVQQFESKLEEMLNGIVKEVYEEMKKELPDQIKGKIEQAMCVYDDRVDVHVDLSMSDNRKKDSGG